MSSFDELYLQNTQKVYFDFKQMSEDLGKAKFFIRSIPQNYLSMYKEIVFSEHEIENSDLGTNFWWVIIYGGLQSLLITILYAFHIPDKVVSIVTPVLTGIIFIIGVNVLHQKKRKSINLQRLLYFLEHYE
ncbi:hypothetical protein [Streptococcus suis]|uniref:hypothetical protein n=1 Tax=Streptococcus suis TaxID=1307 RepID=UPI001584423D|nr:hypothetical protein [Streptococcus suis]